jgi:hypothetical protein
MGKKQHLIDAKTVQLFFKNSYGLLLFVTLSSLFLLPALRKKDGAVAQSVEQRTENPCVAGSIPAHTTALNLGSNTGVFCF